MGQMGARAAGLGGPWGDQGPWQVVAILQTQGSGLGVASRLGHVTGDFARSVVSSTVSGAPLTAALSRDGLLRPLGPGPPCPPPGAWAASSSLEMRRRPGAPRAFPDTRVVLSCRISSVRC